MLQDLTSLPAVYTYGRGLDLYWPEDERRAITCYEVLTMTKWEYFKVASSSMWGVRMISKDGIEVYGKMGTELEALNKLGLEGWEICGFIDAGMSQNWMLKRPIKQDAN